MRLHEHSRDVSTHQPSTCWILHHSCHLRAKSRGQLPVAIVFWEIGCLIFNQYDSMVLKAPFLKFVQNVYRELVEFWKNIGRNWWKNDLLWMVLMINNKCQRVITISSSVISKHLHDWWNCTQRMHSNLHHLTSAMAWLFQTVICTKVVASKDWNMSSLEYILAIKTYSRVPEPGLWGTLEPVPVSRFYYPTILLCDVLYWRRGITAAPEVDDGIFDITENQAVL